VLQSGILLAVRAGLSWTSGRLEGRRGANESLEAGGDFFEGFRWAGEAFEGLEADERAKKRDQLLVGAGPRSSFALDDSGEDRPERLAPALMPGRDDLSDLGIERGQAVQPAR
jgi:hypothetical protein